MVIVQIFAWLVVGPVAASLPYRYHGQLDLFIAALSLVPALAVRAGLLFYLAIYGRNA